MTTIIQAALCSFGMSGKLFHAPFLHVHPGFALRAVWERSRSVATEHYPEVISYESYEELLADKAIDLVIVNTPNYTHFEYAKKALLADKHVIIEKPFTVTVNEAEELIALAKEKIRKLSVYQNRRWDSDFKTVKKVVERGCLGEIVDAEIHFDRFKRELSPKAHKETPGPGAGLLHDLGPHLIDQALHLFGPPQAVFADMHIIRPISKVHDAIDVLLFYPNLRVRLKSSYLVKEPLPAFIFHGSNGSFLKHRADVQEAFLLEGRMPNGEDWGREPEEWKGLLHWTKEGKDIKENIPTEKGNYLDYYQGIYKAFTSDAALPVTAEEGLMVMQVIEAALQSNAEKKRIDLV